MSRPFKPYMGKNTFRVCKEPQDAGEYIYNKRKRLNNLCPQNKIRNYYKIINPNFLCPQNNIQNPYKITNLNINLVTSLDLSGVPVIQQNFPFAIPTNLAVTSIPYLDYTIDPSGNLFGNTICGADNFQNYLRFNQPYTTTNPGYINSL